MFDVSKVKIYRDRPGAIVPSSSRLICISSCIDRMSTIPAAKHQQQQQQQQTSSSSSSISRPASAATAAAADQQQQHQQQQQHVSSDVLDSIAALETTVSTAAATAVRGVAQAVAQEGVAAAHEPSLGTYSQTDQHHH